MLKKILITTVLSAFWLTAAAADTKVSFINDWKWEGPAAPLLLALDQNFFAEESLDVGSADINSLITWRDKNPDVDMKAVYIIYNSPPFAVIGRPSLGVTGPQDLEGHTLGAPAFDGAYAQWPAFVRATGILENRVTIQDVGFPVRETMLASGEVDAITGFSFTSYIGLQKAGVPKSDISLMLMSDFGLDLYGNAIIVNPEFAENNPGAVRAFLRATVRGYKSTIANPTAAIEHVLSRNENSDRETELKRLIMAIGHHIVTDEVRNSGLGDVIDSRLEKSIDQLAEMHKFASKPKASDVFDDRYLPASAFRRLDTP
jgi:NitT/TauT family transport system substrate-binding protein